MDPNGVACTNCGKNMTTDDLRRVNCLHCGQVLAHHARAAQQVALMNQMFASPNLQPMMQNAHARMHELQGQAPPPAGGFGVQPTPHDWVHPSWGYAQGPMHEASLQATQQAAVAARQARNATVLVLTFVFAALAFCIAGVVVALIVFA
ncbi:hypothetical protein AKJ09_03722 [Labilithrix luteola]|uniref:Uncharacterized protein n=1 Tax=Labilithrix luteola TaxID=1391654 RepID=A0A0K1PU40_9BACT|nr:hypothetical protein [Labilithrix luteola]AKU97058.1 hypothetical protein AKJ09_03722 [Labilithrix luteola]